MNYCCASCIELPYAQGACYNPFRELAVAPDFQSLRTADLSFRSDLAATDDLQPTQKVKKSVPLLEGKP